MVSQFQLRISRAGPLETYVAVVVLAGLLACAWSLHDPAAAFQHTDGTFWLLVGCLLPAELIRVPASYQGGAAQLTMSRPFILALLIGWGARPLVSVLVVASVVSDLIHRKPARRICFNAGQYALFISAADAVYAGLGGQRPFALAQLPAFLAAGATYYIVNRLLVRVAVALHHQHPLAIGYLLRGTVELELVEGAVQLIVVLVALLVAEDRPVLPVMLALPALPLVAVGRLAEQVQALMARRRGRASELTDLEARRAELLRTAELYLARLAADLHDGPVQRFQQLRTQIQMIQASIATGSPDAARLLRQVEDEVTAEAKSLRVMITELRPPVLSRLGLAGAITHLAREFEATCGITCVVNATAVEGLSEELEVVLYRVTQEALANAGQHAHASHVQVTVARHDGVVRLEVRDDGTGFDPAVVQENGHYGLALMRQRVELANGTLQVDSRLGYGTTITAGIKLDLP
jgi:signal transduction histidine kinase